MAPAKAEPSDDARDDRASPADSEAETEILSGSQKPTPLKTREIKREDTSEGNGVAVTSPTTAKSRRNAEHAVETADAPSKRKRKVDETVSEALRRGVANGHDENATETSKKRARLSPGNNAGKSADKERTRARSEGEQVNGTKEETRKRRTSDSEDAGDQSNEIVSESRGSTNPPHPPGTTPSPVSSLRSRHRRAASFHSSLPLSERERRSRRRLGSSEEEQHQSHSTARTPRTPRDPNVDKFARTPLHRASDEGDLDRVQAILRESTKDINRPENAGNTPIQLAACSGHHDVVKALIEAGADVNCSNDSGDTPLRDALDNEHDSVIELLREAGATAENKGGQAERARKKDRFLYITPSVKILIENIKSNDLEGIQWCINAGVRPNNNCVVAAVQSGNPEVLSLIIGLGGAPDPEQREVGSKDTPMIAAIHSGSVPMLKTLLELGCNPKRRVTDQKLTYPELSKRNKGKYWQDVYKLLQKAYNGEELSNSSESGSGDEGDDNARSENKDSERNSSEPEPDTAEEAQYEGSPSPRRRRRLITGRQAAEDLRIKYLETLPRGLALPLTKGNDMPIYPSDATDTPEVKLVQHYMPLKLIKRAQLVDDCPVDVANELWMPGFQASVLLGHSKLSELQSDVSETLPMTEEHRRAVWEWDNQFRKQIWEDVNHFQLLARDVAQFKELAESCGLIYVSHADEHGNLISAQIWTDEFEAQQFAKFLSLEQEELFWVPFEDFERLANPENCPRLKDLKIPVDGTRSVRKNQQNSETGAFASPFRLPCEDWLDFAHIENGERVLVDHAKPRPSVVVVARNGPVSPI